MHKKQDNEQGLKEELKSQVKVTNTKDRRRATGGNYCRFLGGGESLLSDGEAARSSRTDLL